MPRQQVPPQKTLGGSGTRKALNGKSRARAGGAAGFFKGLGREPNLDWTKR